MAALSEILAKFDIDTSGLKKGAKDGESAVDGIVGKLKTFGTMLAGGVVLNGIKNMVTGLVDQGSALNDASNQLGISTDALQQWGFAAKLNGVEAGELNKSFLVLQKGMAKAAQSGAQTGGPFQKLGVQLRDAGGNMRETTDVLRDTGLAIARMKSPAERTSAAMEVFGKAGAKLNPLFADGEEGLKKYLAEIDKLGGGISKDAIAGLDDMGDQMDRLDMVWLSAKSKIVSAFVPALTSMVGGLANTLGGLMKTKEGAAALQVGVGALAAAAAAAGLAMLAPWLPIITAITFVGALVQDFIVGLRGGDSLIGRIFNKVFGEGSGQTFFAQVKKDAQALFDTAKELYDFISGKNKDNDTESTKQNAQASAKASEAGMSQASPEAMAFANNVASIFGIAGGGQSLFVNAARSLLRQRDMDDAAQQGNNVTRARTWMYGKSDFQSEAEYQAAVEVDKADVDSVVADLMAGIPASRAGALTTVGAVDESGNQRVFQPTADIAPRETNVTQTNSNVFNITTSDDPDAIAGAAGDSVGEANRRAGDALKRTVPGSR